MRFLKKISLREGVDKKKKNLSFFSTLVHSPDEEEDFPTYSGNLITSGDGCDCHSDARQGAYYQHMVDPLKGC